MQRSHSYTTRSRYQTRRKECVLHRWPYHILNDLLSCLTVLGIVDLVVRDIFLALRVLLHDTRELFERCDEDECSTIRLFDVLCLSCLDFNPVRFYGCPSQELVLPLLCCRIDITNHERVPFNLLRNNDAEESLTSTYKCERDLLTCSEGC